MNKLPYEGIGTVGKVWVHSVFSLKHFKSVLTFNLKRSKGDMRNSSATMLLRLPYGMIFDGSYRSSPTITTGRTKLYFKAIP